MEREKFEKLVEEAVTTLPRKFKKYIHNVAILVEDNPPKTSAGTLLGLYHGVPLKHRGSYYGNVPPDVIIIYQRPIERICFSDEEVKDRVRDVVLHEIGHYFGMTEKDLRDIED